MTACQLPWCYLFIKIDAAFIKQVIKNLTDHFRDFTQSRYNLIVPLQTYSIVQSYDLTHRLLSTAHGKTNNTFKRGANK